MFDFDYIVLMYDSNVVRNSGSQLLESTCLTFHNPDLRTTRFAQWTPNQVSEGGSMALTVPRF